jgi:hypothetical protein
MVILYVYLTCWRMKSVFYELQQQLPWSTRSSSVEMKSRVKILTTTRARIGTRPAVFLPWRNATEDDWDLHDVIHRRDACDQFENLCKEQDHIEQEQRNERDYDYYGVFYDQPHRQCSPEGWRNEGGVMDFTHDLKRVCWPLNFKPSGIDKYNGSTNRAKWLELYQLAIEANVGDSYVMENNLSVCLPASARTWLLGLPTGSVCSWSDLFLLFTSIFRATCAHPGVNWDLTSVV